MTQPPPRTVDLFVDGRWQPPRDGRYEPARSPVTGQVIGQVAQGSRADADAAVAVAGRALRGWAAATAPRGQIGRFRARLRDASASRAVNITNRPRALR